MLPADADARSRYIRPGFRRPSMRPCCDVNPFEQFQEVRVRLLRSGVAKRMRWVRKTPVSVFAHSGRVSFVKEGRWSSVVTQMGVLGGKSKSVSICALSASSEAP